MTKKKESLGLKASEILYVVNALWRKKAMLQILFDWRSCPVGLLYFYIFCDSKVWPVSALPHALRGVAQHNGHPVMVGAKGPPGISHQVVVLTTRGWPRDSTIGSTMRLWRAAIQFGEGIHAHVVTPGIILWTSEKKGEKMITMW